MSTEIFFFIRIVLCGKDGDLLKFFQLKAAEEKIPSLEALLETAKKLQKMYGRPAAYHRALKGTYTNNATKIPEGSTWTPPAKEKSSAEVGQKKGMCKKKKEGNEMDKKFFGDLVVAQSSRFIHDAMISRHATFAVADGDIGSVWECMKVRLASYAKITTCY
jgi:hypothetical protein